ncbi:unnamed protein product [Medioppia subpectinata]|uniref:Peptidase C1A papain C-terminal domain-containing protein n=1 Tax=Medioppia subpectinata TaxID=1979941 RepID=A0A7R9LIM3_9ACAR|nr:unnamed protein product [Medioppia subpectinata]CAG2119080.1 unnamed protein product [Medioppia subpectinata]
MLIKSILLLCICTSVYSRVYKSLSFDWRDRGVVLPVPEPQVCIDSAVINVLDSISAKLALNTGSLISLSRQEVYDCQKDWCPCSKTNPVNSYAVISWLANAHVSIDSETTYRTTGQCTHKCNTNATVVARLGGYMTTGHGDQEDVLSTFIMNSPLVVDVNANTTAWQTYRGGILDDPHCSNTMDAMDHSLLLVGYGSENGTDYWIARNSWGKNWGENGYVRVIQNKNMCGIGNRIAQPVIVG